MRVWDLTSQMFTQLDDIFFQGTIFTVTAYDNGKGVAVGGNFTSVLLDGIQRDMAYLAIQNGEKVWEPTVNADGPVRSILSQKNNFSMT